MEFLQLREHQAPGPEHEAKQQVVATEIKSKSNS